MSGTNGGFPEGRITYGSEGAGNRETRQDGTVFVSLPGRTGCCLLPVRFPETGVSCPLFCAEAFFRNGKGPGRGECSAFAVVYKGFHIYSGDTAAVHGGYVLECGVDGLQHVFRFSCFRVFPANQFFSVTPRPSLYSTMVPGLGMGGAVWRRIITREPSGMRGSMDFPSTRTTYSFLPRGLSM